MSLSEVMFQVLPPMSHYADGILFFFLSFMLMQFHQHDYSICNHAYYILVNSPYNHRQFSLGYILLYMYSSISTYQIHL